MRLVTPLTVTLLSLALGGSLLLNLTLYQSSRRYYTHWKHLHLDPLGLTQYPTSFPDHTALNFQEPDPNRKFVVVLGDSRAANWTVGLPDSVEVINRGIPGQTTGQIVGRTQAHLQDLKVQAVVVQMGINDLTMIPLFPQQERAIIETCKANFLTLVGEVHSLGAKVVLTTLFPLGQVPWERQLIWSDRVGLAVEEINDFIRSLDGAEGVYVLDAARALQQLSALEIQPQYSQDLLHINEAGYDRLNTDLIPVLHEVLDLLTPIDGQEVIRS
ncbi:MAG: SGNH/GDSL hydrolase family protein [Prochlorothrix sp.]|nr:SGNH/GDSL hydrolase family protein [Prochlorothrix sp.]